MVRSTELSIKRTVVQFHLRHFEAWAILFIRLCLCSLEDIKQLLVTLSWYLCPKKVKDLMQGNGKTYCELTNYREVKLKINHS